MSPVSARSVSPMPPRPARGFAVHRPASAMREGIRIGAASPTKLSNRASQLPDRPRSAVGGTLADKTLRLLRSTLAEPHASARHRFAYDHATNTPVAIGRILEPSEFIASRRPLVAFDTPPRHAPRRREFLRSALPALNCPVADRLTNPLRNFLDRLPMMIESSNGTPRSLPASHNRRDVRTSPALGVRSPLG